MPSGKEKLASFEGDEEEAAAAAVEEEEEEGVAAAAVAALAVKVEGALPTPLRTSALPHGVGCAHRAVALGVEPAAFPSSAVNSGRRRTTTLILYFEENERG